MEKELKDKVALVTGASRNIGRAIAEELAAAGALVIVNAVKSRDLVEAVVAGVHARGGQAEAYLADVTDPTAVEEMISHIRARYGRLDILVNNAVTHQDRKFLESSYEDWRRTLTIILDGAYLCIRNAVPVMIEGGGGSIVNIGGLAGHMYMYDRVPVSAAKAGVAGMTRALAGDLSGLGITVNCVVPGPTNTVRAKPSRQNPAEIPISRLAEPLEIAGMVRYLCGPRSRYTTGQTVHINGGLHMD